MNVTDKMLDARDNALAAQREKERAARPPRIPVSVFVIAAAFFAAGVGLIVSNVRV